MDYKLMISSYSHVAEPPDLLEQLMDEGKWGDAISQARNKVDNEPYG